MKEVSCGVIRDLLPLYRDSAASPETQELVEEHLKTCPACQEELRKIGAPVCLPPDEDTRLLERFNHKRMEKRRRKWKLELACAGAAAVLILIFCLWYVRPRSWTEIIGTEETVYLRHCNLITDAVYDGKPSADLWVLRSEEAKGPAAEPIMAALQGGTYRPSLRNVLNHTIFCTLNRTISSGKIGDACVFIGDHGGEPVLSIDVYGDGKVILLFEDNYGECYVFQTDIAVYEALSEAIKTYGEFQEH